jgi:hypothetical protein
MGEINQEEPQSISTHGTLIIRQIAFYEATLFVRSQKN